MMIPPVEAEPEIVRFNQGIRRQQIKVQQALQIQFRLFKVPKA
jgi:hypothetical protein